jgi:hypothetical protein
VMKYASIAATIPAGTSAIGPGCRTVRPTPAREPARNPRGR